MSNYKKLDVWIRSMQLVKDVYQVIDKYPPSEAYALSSQTRRAAISVPCNIAEGIGRNYKKDTIQFLHIARGSLYELDTLFGIARMVNLLEEKRHKEMEESVTNCMQLLNGLIRYYEKSNLK